MAIGWRLHRHHRGPQFLIDTTNTGGYFYLAKTGYLDLATSGYFFMATDRGPSRSGTGAVSERHPTGVPNRAPLNPSTESPSEPGDSAAQILHAVSDSWRLGECDAHTLLPAIESALARGWPAADLATHLIRNPNGARDPIRVLARRLTHPWQPPSSPAPAVPWCGECEDAHSRTITVTEADGTEAARFCPQCSPQVHRNRSSVQNPVKIAERW
ncbi:hypothetical protein TM48_04674 [Mycobacterium shottsii]|nr:hypothetical protein TM48_04674 [Mycobacterium shottsii]